MQGNASGSPDATQRDAAGRVSPKTHGMAKLVEREPALRASPLAKAPALAIQFFLIPLAVVGVIVLVYGGFRTLVTTERTPEEFLSDVRTGGRERRWPAAFELSRLLADPETEVRHPNIGAAIVQAFVDSEGDDPRVRQYLALALGRLTNPPAGAAGELVKALDSPDAEVRISVIWALASLGDPGTVDDIEAMYLVEDAGVRKMAIYALGALPGTAHMATLRNALDDPAADVQWNAAVALARHGLDDGLPVLRRMIDRPYVERMVTLVPTPQDAVDPVAAVMVSALQAVAALGSSELNDQIRALSENDASLQVRNAALEALDALPSAPRQVGDAARAIP